MVGMATSEPGMDPTGDTAVLERDQTRMLLNRPWQVIVWNDPVNLMSYVAYVFRSYFGYSATRARELMLEVHERGRAVVASGSQEEAEQHVQAMHGFGLWATCEQRPD